MKIATPANANMGFYYKRNHPKNRSGPRFNATMNERGSPSIASRGRSRRASETEEDPAPQAAGRTGESRVLPLQKLHTVIEGMQTNFNP